MNLDLSESVEQAIVNGLARGYKDYLHERQQKRAELKVSGAFAWTKGNIVDSAIDKATTDVESMHSKIAKAGYAWEYLQFMYMVDDKSLIIIKEARSARKAFGEQKPAKENYMSDLAGINNHLHLAEEKKNAKRQGAVQLELSFAESVDETQPLTSGQFDRFYIVTYKIDDETKRITDVALTMPIQSTMELVQIADLSPLLVKTGVEFTDEELSSVQGEVAPEAQYGPEEQGFGYIPDQQQQENQ